MMLSDAERSMFEIKRIFVVLTNVCNAECVMCNNTHFAPGTGSSLTFEDVQQIARFAVDTGAAVMDFSGGEPFMFPRIDELIRDLGSSNVQLNIVTNGTAITSKHLDAIAGAKNVRLQLSTHGLGEVEDAIKAIPNASRMVDKNLQRLVDVGATVSIATVVQRRNLHQLIDIYRRFSSVPYTHHSFVMYEPIRDVASMVIDPADVRITADRVAEFRQQMHAVIDAARSDGKAINLDAALVEKYVERIVTESPHSNTACASSGNGAVAVGAQVPAPPPLAGTPPAGGAQPGDVSAAPDTTPPVEIERTFSHAGMLCTIPRRNLFINDNGDVLPCMHFDWKSLNPRCSIKAKPIQDLVYSREYVDMVLTAIGPGGCPGCDAACYIWDPDFRRRATQPNGEDRALALLTRRHRTRPAGPAPIFVPAAPLTSPPPPTSAAAPVDDVTKLREAVTAVRAVLEARKSAAVATAHEVFARTVAKARATVRARTRLRAASAAARDAATLATRRAATTVSALWGAVVRRPGP